MDEKLVETTRITDLNYDCLDAILDYLKYEDLFNAAVSNKHINNAAKLTFNRKFSQQTFIFYVESITERLVYFSDLQKKRSELRNKGVLVDDLKDVLTLLRCFGSVMKKIWVHFCCKNYNQYIASYINQFCTESLLEIHLIDFPIDILDYFKQPFTEVTTVRLEITKPKHEHQLVTHRIKSSWMDRIKKVCLRTSQSQNQLIDNNWIKELFPNINDLELSTMYYQYSWHLRNGNTVKYFPNLKRLCYMHNDIYDTNADDSAGLSLRKEHAINTIKLNPHIEILKIRAFGENGGRIFNAHFFRSTENCLQNLKMFCLSMESKYFFSKSNSKKIHLKNVTFFQIQIYECNEQFKFPFYFDKLETLLFHLELCRYFGPFVQNHPTITTLYLDFDSIADFECLQFFMNKCPSMTKIDCLEVIDVEDVGKMLNYILATFNSLDFIKFKFSAQLNEIHAAKQLVLKSIQKYFDDDWLMSIFKANESVSFVSYWDYGRRSYDVELRRRIIENQS